MKTTIFSAILLFFVFQVSGQRPKMDPKMMEEIKTKKIAFITEKVGFTPQEAQKFWPLYNQMEKDRYELMGRRHDLEESSDNAANKTEEFYKNMANEIVSIHTKDAKLIEEYNSKFLSVLSAEKVVKLYRAEGKFRSFLMHELRKDDEDKPKVTI
jgi:hypothetical protein